MAFKKGQSGNPGGRPKELKEIRDLAKSRGAQAIGTLAQIARSGKSESARVAAAIALLDRGFGRPSQQLEHTGKDGKDLPAPTAAQVTIIQLPDNGRS